MNTLILPQIAFAANYEEEIKSIIFNAMDCKLQSNRRFNHETRWFKDFPEFILTASPSWSDNSVIEISRELGKSFEMSIERINDLYTLIKGLFPNGKFTTVHNNTYDITVHQIFSLGDYVWASIDLQSVFYCEPPAMPIEYTKWMSAVRNHDYTYHYSDSSTVYKAGEVSDKHIAELKSKLDHRVCTLWYNYILGRMRVRPQDSSFGDHIKAEWNTLEEAYKEFSIMPSHAPYVEPGKVPTNKPCLGFTAHAKRTGWMEGDMKYESYVSNNYYVSREEYRNSQTPVTVFHNYVEGGRLVSEKCETNKHDLPKLLKRESWQDQYYTLEPEGKLK